MLDMVKDHEEDVAAFRRASRVARDPGVRAFAAKTLPTLEMHLQMARDTATNVGARGGGSGGMNGHGAEMDGHGKM
jgi:putative membrane protein